MARSYAGIGSRSTPADVLALIRRLAAHLSEQGFTLRSGGADGADSAFEAGCTGTREIYLPWPGFNGNRSPLHNPSQGAMSIASAHHPAWDRLTPGGKALHARNCHQVLGRNLDDPVEFIVCWTPGASGSGGTGQALRLAKQRGIRVLDLGDASVRRAVERRLAALRL